jgi:branched-chain amino acid transport system substrate-binding protein
MKTRNRQRVRNYLKTSSSQIGRSGFRRFSKTIMICAVLLGFIALGPFSTTSLADTKPLKIGVLEPLSGPYTSLGQHALSGMKVCFEQRGWTVAGRKIELIVEDTELNPQVAMRKARKLVEKDEVDILMGVVSSAIGYALKDYVTRAKKVWVACAAGADGVFKKANFSPYAFGSRASTSQISATMGRWLLKSKGYKRVFITGPDYAMGREMTKAFKEGWGSAGGPPAVGEVLAPVGTNDYAPYLAQIKNAEPECVYASFAGGDAVRFVKQFEEFGLKKKIQLTGMGYLVEEDTTPAQGDAAIGVYTCFVTAYGLDIPENKKFKEYYAKQFNRTPSVDDYLGYGGALVVYEAIKKLKGDTRDQLALSKAIQSSDLASPFGRIRFDPVTNNGIFDMLIRESRKVDGEIHNYVIETIKDVVHPHE